MAIRRICSIECVKPFDHSACQSTVVKVALHRGLFENTVRFSPDDAVVLAHVDCDWYDPVKLCLERTLEVLRSGGFIILDDYNDYGGCRKATDEFLAVHPQLKLVRTLPHAVIRKD